AKSPSRPCTLLGQGLELPWLHGTRRPQGGRLAALVSARASKTLRLGSVRTAFGGLWAMPARRLDAVESCSEVTVCEVVPDITGRELKERIKECQAVPWNSRASVAPGGRMAAALRLLSLQGWLIGILIKDTSLLFCWEEALVEIQDVIDIGLAQASSALSTGGEPSQVRERPRSSGRKKSTEESPLEEPELPKEETELDKVKRERSPTESSEEPEELSRSPQLQEVR
ncbi:unnamed protein product, partial [Effrenium voratum]